MNKACQYMASPQDSHWAVVKRILCYLNGTLELGFLISPAAPLCKLSLRAYSDSILIGQVISMIDDPRQARGFFLAQTLFQGARRSKTWWLGRARRQNIVHWLTLRLSCFGLSPFCTNFRCHFSPLLCCVTTSVRFRFLTIQSFMPAPNTSNWISILYVSVSSPNY